jgi:hypothetical protein
MRGRYRGAPYLPVRPAACERSGRGDTARADARCIIGRMTIASPAVHDAPEQLRDELTRQRLLTAVDHLPGLVVESFDRAWWDGQVRVPSLVVRGGRRLQRMRVVETDGTCLVVPFSRRLASRWLSARRRPDRAELDAFVRRSRGKTTIDGLADAVRCASRGCGALLPISYPDCCPLCGG